MDTIHGKEGKGVRGSGFEGDTPSNKYVELPKSSNAGLGVDMDIAAGSSTAAKGGSSKGLNVGDPGAGPTVDNMSNEKFGIGGDIADGTVRGRKIEGVIEQRRPGSFGVSALSGGSKMLNPDGYYGSGARKEGTAAQFGEPGRGGSMGLAIKGLSGDKSGGDPQTERPKEGAQKSMEASRPAFKRSTV